MAKRRKPSLGLALYDETEPAFVPSIVYSTLIRWRDGQPTLLNCSPALQDDPEGGLRALMKSSLSLPYSGSNPALQGLTLGEALIIQMARDAADGDATARADILDRIMGKAQQNIKSVNLSGDINEFLDRVAASTRTTTVEIETPTDAVIVDEL